jgi:hypothetical protein
VGVCDDGSGRKKNRGRGGKQKGDPKVKKRTGSRHFGRRDPGLGDVTSSTSQAPFSILGSYPSSKKNQRKRFKRAQPPSNFSPLLVVHSLVNVPMFRRSRLSSSIPDDVRAAVDEENLEGLMRRADRGRFWVDSPCPRKRERSGRLTSWQGCGSARGVLTGGDRGR